jgi:signal transduction histidine kinase
MREELESITASDLDRRVDTPGTGDELERLGVAMNETIDRLGSAVTANERFVADAAHELRSPITGVRAALEVEAAGSPDGLIADAVTELDRASRLIDDLLLLARRQAGTLDHTDVDLDDVVAASVAAFRTRFERIDIEMHIEPVRVVGDADALRRVVSNLLENACRYGAGRLSVTLVPESDRCVLRVDDDGPGIPGGERSVVFERFARLDASRSRETGGSGLGLAIVDEVVAAHDGTITVAGADLGGARFEVTLPRAGQSS